MIVLCIWLSGTIFGSNSIETTSRNPFAMPSDSIVLWKTPEESTPFDRLWQTMDSLISQKEGSLSCLYVGGSHVQAGWIGHGIRDRFENHIPGSDKTRGWLLPYRMAQTDTPTHFRTDFEGIWSGFRCTNGGHDGPFGSSGMRAHTSDVNATWQHLSIRSDSSFHEAYTLEVWGAAEGCIPNWLGHETLKKRQEIPNGNGWTFTFDNAVDTLKFGLERIQPGPLSFDLFATVQRYKSNKSPQFTLYEWGNNGAKISSAMRCSAWEHELPLLDLDIIILGLGLNDVHSSGSSWNANLIEEQYCQLVERIQNTVPQTALVLLSNTDSMRKGVSMTKQSHKFRSIQQKIARQLGCATFDLGQAMGPAECIQFWNEQGLAQSDLIHFTPEGYDVLAELLFSSWIGTYNAQKTSFPVSSSHQQ